MLEKTLIYVDTSYLLASFYNSWNTGARAQLEIDLPEVVAVLGQIVHDQFHQPVHRQLWYDGIPESGPHRYQRTLRNEPYVQLRTGQLIEWGDRRSQKAVDTRLVADMVIAAHKAHISDFVLVSGDADMLPGVEEAVNAGIRVHLFGFSWESMSSQLRYACDTTTILDPREDFRDTMRLEILEGPLPAETTTEPTAKTQETTHHTSIECEETLPLSPNHNEENHTSETPLPDQPSQPNNTTITAETLSLPEKKLHEYPTEIEKKTPCVLITPTKRIDTHKEQHKDTCQHKDTWETPDNTTTHTTDATEPHTQNTPAQAPPELTPQAHNETQTEPAQTDTAEDTKEPKPRPNPGMMAKRRKLRSRYLPLPTEVWVTNDEQNPFDIGQQYAIWWFDNMATSEEKDNAHLLSGGGLPPNIDRPLLQFACDTLHEYTLSETQRVALRDGFHSGIRVIMLR